MYSVNQVNQLYVVKAVKTAVESGDAAGTLYAKTNTSNSPVAFETNGGIAQYFKYMGAGGLISTDRIKKGKVKWVSYTTAASMAKKRRVCTIAIPSGTTPIVGQDYIINFSFRNYFGMSDEDTYEKFAVARAMDTNAKSLYRDLAISLAKNMSREVDMPFKIQLGSGTNNGTLTDVLPTTKATSLSGNYTAIVLTELDQPYKLGRLKSLRPEYTVSFSPAKATVSSAVVETSHWANYTDTFPSTNPVTNGRETADLEWFCMGERGDQYRGKDWPLSITTPASLLVNPDGSYDYVVVHFWDDIDNEGPQKSERDMTFVANVNTTTGGSATNAIILGNLAKNIALAAGLDSYIVDGVSTPTVAAQSGSGS